MIFVIHLWLFILYTVGVLFYVAARWSSAGWLTASCRAAVYGLLVSVLGLVLPFALALSASWLFYGHAIPVGKGGDVGSTLLALFVLFGPLVGPPVVFALTVFLYLRRHRPNHALQPTAGASGLLSKFRACSRPGSG